MLTSHSKIKAVQPSHIRHIEYDPETETLTIVFQRGGTYEYFGVPEAVYVEFYDSPSRWGYFLTHIRKGYRNRPKKNANALSRKNK